jgi:FixJ family two-component response regulator
LALLKAGAARLRRLAAFAPSARGEPADRWKTTHWITITFVLPLYLHVNLPDAPACLVLDVRLPGTSGLELQEHLASKNISLPVTLITDFVDVPMSVKGMKLGAVDFLTKPIRDQDLPEAVAVAIRMNRARREHFTQITQLQEKYALLTARERQVMALIASGLMNKVVASKLSISEVTVKMHRGSVMRKTGANSVAMLARMAEVLGIEQ